MALLECVPNISEGRSQATLDAVANAVRQVEGVKLLDVDPGFATHRTVFTFVGEPEAVIEGAFALIAESQRRIDMRQHRGEHPRQGATDVCPLVPVQGISLKDTVEWSKKLASRVGRELNIPVYLYEEAATRPERCNLADIRAGEYEAIRRKLGRPEWEPDYGPNEWNESVAKSGVTVIGARPFLVAYNVNLNTSDRKRAQDIAMSLRESGRVARDESGDIAKGPDGKKLRTPGRLKGVKAVGWVIEEYGRAQVSMNITDLGATPLHQVFDVTVEEADTRGIRVTGSELIGLIPLKSIVDAGRHYLNRMGASTGIPESDIVRVAIQSLGLSEIAEFDPKKKIIEYAIASETPLAAMKVEDFITVLSSDSPAPGGGSVAALVGSLGGALASMVANLTHPNCKSEFRREVETLACQAQDIKTRMLKAIDDDTAAFDSFLAARRLPKSSPKEIELRDIAVARSVDEIIEVPLSVVRHSHQLVPVLERLFELGIPSALSDIGVAALAIETASQGAHLNVLINLGEVASESKKSELKKTSGELVQETVQRARALTQQFLERMDQPRP